MKTQYQEQGCPTYGGAVLITQDASGKRGHRGYIFDVRIDKSGVLYEIEVDPGVVALLRREDFCVIERA